MAEESYLHYFDDAAQVDVFARGLYYLAGVDGVDDTEVDVIREFLKEMGLEDLLPALGKAEFSLPALCRELSSSHQRQLFLKTAIVLIRADGVISDAERKGIDQVAEAFGMTDELADLEEAMGDFVI